MACALTLRACLHSFTSALRHTPVCQAIRNIGGFGRCVCQHPRMPAHTFCVCVCCTALACAAGSGAGPRSWVAPASAAVRALACIRCHARDVDLGCGLRRALHHSASLLAAPLLPRSLQLRSLLQSSCSRSARISPERWDVLRGLWAKRAAWSSRRGWCVGVKGAWVAYRTVVGSSIVLSRPLRLLLLGDSKVFAPSFEPASGKYVSVMCWSRRLRLRVLQACCGVH